MKNLIFDGCDTSELAKKYGTPLYLISETMIRERCQTIKKDFLNKYPNTKAVYASKAFLPLAMCKIIASEHIGLDVVSGGELFTALEANVDPKKIEFNGNNKSYEELEMAITSGVGRLIVDNLFELEMIEKIAKLHSLHPHILFRIVPETDTDTHDYISTGHKSSKFGVALENNYFFSVFEKALHSKHVTVKGIHFHIGSQLHTNKSHLNAVKKTLHLVEDLYKKYDYLVDELNVGGGFGIKYTEDDPVKSFAYFMDPIMALIDDFFKERNLKRPGVIIEPGRWIVGEAGITLYTIGAIKTNGHIKYAAIDGGMSDNIRPSLYQAKYACSVANKIDQPLKEKYTISGKFCESSDILIKDVNLPSLESNDLLAVYSTGAYTYSMASNYNKILIPAVVLVNKGQSYTIVKRQSYKDLLRFDLIPKHLEV